MDKATEKVYKGLILECIDKQIALEGEQEYELAGYYREKEVELKNELEYLRTPEGWQKYLEYRREAI